MSDICERRVVHRLESDASRSLAAFVAEHRSGDGSVRIVLRLPVPMMPAWKSVIERPGIADFYTLQSGNARFPTYSVTWSARNGGAFPAFSGALAVERLTADDRFRLLLCGYYEPPLGRFGEIFDALVGNRLAHASARDLLGAIATYIERLPERLPLPHEPLQQPA